MKNTYSLYKHTTPEGKVYIGVTCQNPKSRWQKEGRGYKGCRLFYEAILTHGWGNIAHEILASGLTKEEAFKAEQELIEQYDARNPDKGYNLTIGGACGWSGMHHTDESKTKLSLTKLGEKNPMYGKHLSEEHKRILSEANKGTKKSPVTLDRMRKAQSNRSAETRKRQSDSQDKRPVICVETGEVFEGVAIAARSKSLSDSNISACCKGKRKTTGGFHWEYVEGHANTEVTTGTKDPVAP